MQELAEAMLLADLDQDTVSHCCSLPCNFWVFLFNLTSILSAFMCICSSSQVDFAPNFDNSQKEPSVLPARLPTLLLNGSSGIAVIFGPLFAYLNYWYLFIVKSCICLRRVVYSYIHQVGMATNIPPHNLGEVVDVLCVMIHNPEATVSANFHSLFDEMEIH